MTSSENHDDFKVIYEKICQAHDAITDFRAKLLAALPIVSGAGIFLLIGDKAPNPKLVPYLLPIGIFGAVVAFGLFCYELRGIQECHVLIACGKSFEQELGGKLKQAGRFISKPNPFRFFDAPGAALIIYPAVIGAWFYVATIGLLAMTCPKSATDFNLDLKSSVGTLVVFLFAFAAFSLIGRRVRFQQEKDHKKLEGLAKLEEELNKLKGDLEKLEEELKKLKEKPGNKLK
jgi:hypothetical protein